ncbi:dephospho-CoA kinase [Flavobacterium sp. ASW18X]|uniref:dephospho-CoA kinase n=1 Tax=Flavobacterium sp. ASW18X TaxID=2572595 RepID=UPI0010AE6ED7|nr:dephospho-CoA kinase [Flavobacterium sp. ASW18X]TKD65851.1 dephospho-CoA kinase [Flavobacterium sp. ASW18X]
MIVGLTGGIGSGKSTVAKMFQELGIPVYIADEEAKKLMHTQPEVKSAIIHLLGKDAYLNGRLNRAYIADKVFTNKGLLQELNAIVHPAVRTHFLEWVKKQEAPYVLQESALIFENNNEANFDAVILVTAPEEVRLARVVKRDQVALEKVRARMANQLAEAEKKDRATLVIENTLLSKTKEKVAKIHLNLLKQASCD